VPVPSVPSIDDPALGQVHGDCQELLKCIPARRHRSWSSARLPSC